MSEHSAGGGPELFTSDGVEVARAQAWLANEREAGRLALELSNAFLARLLNAAMPGASEDGKLNAGL